MWNVFAATRKRKADSLPKNIIGVINHIERCIKMAKFKLDNVFYYGDYKE